MKQKLRISAERKAKDLTSIGKTITPLARQLLGTSGLIEIELLTNWQNIVGSNLSQYSMPQKISFKKDERINGCLTICVLSGAFAMEIKQNEPKILDKINSFFGYKAVSQIKIMQDSNPENFLIGKKITDKVKKNIVSEAEENYITELASGINNSALRSVVERLGLAVAEHSDK